LGVIVLNQLNRPPYIKIIKKTENPNNNKLSPANTIIVISNIYFYLSSKKIKILKIKKIIKLLSNQLKKQILV
jgi:hypothetical protein